MGPVRGYIKLLDAARAFKYNFKGKVVLDIGSSTGGFTKYALEQGAAKVIAIEKGTNQMMAPLRFDPRIDLHEKTDILGVVKPRNSSKGTGPKSSSLPPKDSNRLGNKIVLSFTPDVILADVSFESLTKILKYAKLNLSRSNTDFLVMLKPQFETKDPRDLKNGIVKNETIRRKIIKSFERWLKENGFIVIDKKDNILEGRHGNIERFYFLKREAHSQVKTKPN